MAKRAAKRKTARRKTAKTKPAAAPAAELSPIADDLRPLAVPIEDLVPDPANARTHGDGNLQAIAASLSRYGQRKPVVANRANRQVEAGNGLIAAAKWLKWTHVAVVWVDDDPNRQRGFALADNRAAELAGWDQGLLDALLQELSAEEPELLATLEVDSLIADLDAAAEAEGKQFVHPADKPLEETPAPAAFQGMPLEEMLAGCRRRVVLFSGGKDSMATVSWMLDRFAPEEFELMWNKTPLDYPDLEGFVTEFAASLGVTLHKVRSDYEGPAFIEQIKRNGLPAEMRSWCTGNWKVRPTVHWLKAEKLFGSREDVLVVGWRREEGLRRSQASDRVLSPTHDMVMARPILDMTEPEVYAEAQRRGWALHWCYEYDSRLGCLYCHNLQPKTFVELRRRRPDLWWYMLKLLAIGSRAASYQPQLGKAIRRLVGEDLDEPCPFVVPEGAAALEWLPEPG